MTKCRERYLTLFGVLCLASCGMMDGALEQTESCTIIVPGSPPGAEFSASGVLSTWTVHWYTPDGVRRDKAGIVDECTLTLERGFTTPIILIPEIQDSPLPLAGLPKAGAIYPVHAETRPGDVALRADYLRGIAAVCAESALLCAAGGFDNGHLIISRFNWLKFEDRLLSIEDPGLLDTGRFIAALLGGKMSVYDVTASNKRAYRVVLASGTIPAGTVFSPGWVGGTGFSWTEAGAASLELPDRMVYFLSPVGFLSVDCREGGGDISLFTSWSLQD